MALYSVAQGGVVNAGDVDQIVNLLTGQDTSQQVTVANRIAAATNGVTTGGFVGTTAGTGGAPTSTTGISYAAGDFSSDGSNKPGLYVTNGTTWYPVKAQRRSTLAKTGAFSLTANTWTALLWDTSVYSTDSGIWSSGSTITATVTGTWRISMWWQAPGGVNAARVGITCSALGFTNSAIAYSPGGGNAPPVGFIETQLTAGTTFTLSLWGASAMSSTSFNGASLGADIELIG